MGRGNGKPDVDPEQLDIEHELTAGDDGSADTVSSGETELAATRGEMDKLKAERDMLVDRLARMQAEFENARRRAQKEQQDFRDFALADAVKQLLPVMDSLDRALQTQSKNPGDFRAGIELIDKQFHDVMKKLGVVHVGAKGEAFDPNVHEAVEMVDTSEVKDNHVVEELQRGYKLKERLLRPAMVRVARNPKR
jgi:molecular chaperone GrpE